MSKFPPGLILLLALACKTTPGTEDAAPPDLGADLAADTAPDLPPPRSTDSPCNVAGCAPIPACPGTCPSPCGCCPCLPGSKTCMRPGGQSAIQACGGGGGCWDYTLCPDGSGCVEPVPGQATCATSTADCGRIEASYARELQRSANLIARPGTTAAEVNPDWPTCYSDETCQVTAGHCSIGLGACWYVGGVQREALDDLASLWQRLGCGGAVSCDCPALPMRAHCPRRDGPCVVR